MTRTSGWRLLRQHSRPTVKAVAALAAWSTIECVPSLLSGVLVAAAVDRGFLRGDVLTGLRWLGLLAAAYVVAVLATRRVYPLLRDLVEPMRDELVRTVATAALARAVYPVDAADTATAASTQATYAVDAADTAEVDRLTEQTESVRQLVSAMLRTVRQVVIGLVACVFGVAALAPGLVPYVVAPLLLSLIVYVFSLRPLASRQRDVVLAGENVARQAGPVLRGLRDIVACGAERRAATAVHDAIDEHRRRTVAAARTGIVRMVVVLLGGRLPVLLMLAAAPGLVADHRLSVGELTGAIVYLTAHLAPALATVIEFTTSWGIQLHVTLGRLAEKAAPARPPRHHRRPAPPAGDIAVAGLTFSYGTHAAPVLDRLDLHVPYGQHLAVVGPSGVGKSTLANLLTGIAEPQHGEVLLGGVPVTEIDRLLPDCVALIPQQAYVFSGTLWDNLRYLNADASDADLVDAVRALGLAPVLERIGGLDTVVGAGGVALSAGERQAVALARVYMSAATVVVLDEATCHLDPVAEAAVEAAFAKRIGTLIVIAHRMSSALRADRILLLDGSGTAYGGDDDLRRSSRTYNELIGYWEERTDRLPAAADR